MELLVTIRDKIADYKGNVSYVCGNSDYVIHFDMDEEWAAHETKTARFVKQDGTYQDQVFTGNICPVPVISNTYGIRVGVFAGDLHTTTPAYIPAKKSILCASGLPAAPADDVYAQIMQKIDDGLLKGEKGDKGEPGEPGPAGPQGEPGKDGSLYELPTASAEVKGGVRIGKGLAMDGDVLGVEPAGWDFTQTLEVTEADTVAGFKFSEPLIDFSLFVDVPENDTAITGGIEIYKGKELVGYRYFGQAVNTTRCSYLAESIVEKGESRIEVVHLANTNGTTAKANGGAASKSLIDTPHNEPYTQISLYLSGAKYFPVGTVFEFKGVRANA